MFPTPSWQLLLVRNRKDNAPFYSSVVVLCC